jgi:predicted amidohydrolase YtcJ
MTRTLLLGAFMSLLAPAAFAHDPADLVLRGGKVWAGKGLPPATAVAARGERIVLVGTDAEAAAYVGPKTRVVELEGRLVVPGFNDAHVHFLDGGFGLLSVDLRDCKDEADFARRLGEFPPASSSTP